jgi:hypothetical protein
MKPWPSGEPVARKRAALFALLLVLPAHAVHACRCKAPTPEQAYVSAFAVIEGKVSRFRAAPSGEGGAATLEITRTYKNHVSESVIVATATDCFFAFEQGREYLVFLRSNKDGTFWTTRCTGTAAVEQAAATRRWLERRAAGKN